MELLNTKLKPYALGDIKFEIENNIKNDRDLAGSSQNQWYNHFQALFHQYKSLAWYSHHRGQSLGYLKLRQMLLNRLTPSYSIYSAQIPMPFKWKIVNIFL